ncbi:MAG: secondary thiamine-phosphate synthase enzyme YjbQ [Bacteroidales bacterium]|nr:secondary thiamine-phosphate synthase enzyme YjbQ [Bacteroidales bacterium]MDD3666370.1 secondary thiamine-phosphate synthase enzyme YjbQ [Bacteroidales bacterium]
MKQIIIPLPPFQRGFHLITRIIEQQLPSLPEAGLLNLFIQHTSAGLAINENADPLVRHDLESTFNKLIPENQPWYRHNSEGSDDMPAHTKSLITGTSVNIPIVHKKLGLGTWQGIYLCEFRNHAGSRTIVATVID